MDGLFPVYAIDAPGNAMGARMKGQLACVSGASISVVRTTKSRLEQRESALGDK